MATTYKPGDIIDLGILVAEVTRLRAALQEAYDILYPPEDPEQEWEVETIEYVAAVIVDALSTP